MEKNKKGMDEQLKKRSLSCLYFVLKEYCMGDPDDEFDIRV